MASQSAAADLWDSPSPATAGSAASSPGSSVDLREAPSAIISLYLNLYSEAFLEPVTNRGASAPIRATSMA
jgi:hypothetical protein